MDPIKDKPDFFISYAAADRIWAEWIAWVLEDAGYSVVLQIWDFRPGSNVVLNMQAALAGRTLVLLSPAYLSSRQAQAEWAAAFAEDPGGKRGRLVPVRIRPGELRGLFAQVVYIDLVGLPEDEARAALLGGLSRGRDKPDRKPAFPAGSREYESVEPVPDFLSENLGPGLAAMPADRMPAPSPLPPGSRVPLSPNPDFVDREYELRAISRAFGREPAGPRAILLRGAAGIGKTALAAEFAHRFGSYFAGGVYWIHCADPRSVQAEIASCGGSSGLALRPDFEDLPLANQVRLVQKAWSDAVARLLVFDACERLEVLERWLPGEGGSRVLVTSRSLDCAESGPLSTMQVLALGPMSNAQGVVLLRRCSREPSSGDQALARLSSALGGLPLALHLAGGLLHDQTAGDLLHDLQPGRSRSTEPLWSSLAWSIEESFRRLDSEDPVAVLARSLASRAACLAPAEPIPLRLLAASAERSEGDPALTEALDRLRCLGLVEQGDAGTLLHPTVASWLRERAAPADRQAVERAVGRELDRAEEAGETGRLIPWQAHLRAVVDTARQREDAEAARLCEAFARHLQAIGDREGALAYLERAVAIYSRLQPDSLELAAVQEGLGSLLREGDERDLREAQALYEQAQFIRRRQRRGDSQALAHGLYTLGLIAQTRGNREPARHHLEQALSMWERLLGPDAPDTIAARNQLQLVLGEQGLAEREFLQAVPWGKSLLSRLRRDRASLVQIRAIGPSRWLLRARIPEELQEAFGTAPEVLFLVVHGEVRGQDLRTAEQELQKKDLDVDPDLLVIADDQPKLEERLDRVPFRWGQWIPWPLGKRDVPSLADQLRKHLALYDVFEQRDPVRGRQVIGRDDIVSDLRKRAQGGQAVGIFGLRKVGKTTVVRAVTDGLDPLGASQEGRASMLVAWLDMERLPGRTLNAVTGTLRAELERRLARETRAVHGPLPGGEGDPSAVLEAALDRTDLPICVVLDEYDLLFGGSAGQPSVAGVERLFRAFRASAQQTARLSLIVIGRDPGFFESPEMNGWPNPMLNWVVPRWLGPLSAGEASELLVKLGRRVLLDVGPETTTLAYQWTGGYPLLHRQFGSALLERSRLVKSAAGKPVATDPLCRAALDLFLARDAVTTTCREVAHLLATRYPEAATLLDDLCCRPPDLAARIVGEQIGWHRPEARLLRNFGLLLADAGGVRVPEVFRWYWRTLAPQAQGRLA